VLCGQLYSPTVSGREVGTAAEAPIRLPFLSKKTELQNADSGMQIAKGSKWTEARPIAAH
jgi:hypothetical protein